MRKNFKMLTRDGKTYILKYEVGLFGPGWNSVATFSAECKAECNRIVTLMNECDNKTHKDDDRERYS